MAFLLLRSVARQVPALQQRGGNLPKMMIHRCMATKAEKIAAFSDGSQGGNPAGVIISDQHPTETEMRNLAGEIGFSETAFVAPYENGNNNDDTFRVRYFSPECEVPFCGHATIALGAALALRKGDGLFKLVLNDAEITVEGQQGEDGVISAALQSPPTHSSSSSSSSSSEEEAASSSPQFVADALHLFGYTRDDLDPRIPPARIHGGSDHFVLALKSREALAAMTYELEAGRELMNRAGILTFVLVYAETEQKFHTRNPFASGGVYEDPATGSATAAFAGYLRDIGWPLNKDGGTIDVVQGEDMGVRSLLRAEISPVKGSSIRISGTARVMDDV
jgi:PhzF family phenazine biosynthesis protein